MTLTPTDVYVVVVGSGPTSIWRAARWELMP
jgi:hypothetical protein